jgi:large subunit ribosomal protein L25
MSELTIEVNRREKVGKNENRRLRVQEQIPAVVYGGGVDPVSIHVSKRKIDELLKSEAGTNAIFLLQLVGTDKSRHAMIRELDRDPINGKIRHIDFQRITLDRKIRVVVHIELRGEVEGMKAHGGLVDFMTREVHVEAFPNQIPRLIEVNVADLTVGHHVEARELILPEGVELSEDPNRVIVSRTISHEMDEKPAEEAEPEVMIKGKKPSE